MEGMVCHGIVSYSHSLPSCPGPDDHNLPGRASFLQESACPLKCSGGNHASPVNRTGSNSQSSATTTLLQVLTTK
jgi:hypothetical protein